MSEKGEIAKALHREVAKVIARHNGKAAAAAKDRRRFEKRSGLIASTPTSSTPGHWKAHPQFNPYYVRGRLNAITHAVTRGVRNGTYSPLPALVVSIPKPDGGSRDIAISTVPDSAVSYWLGRRLIERNSYRFSSYSYAYRADRNAHHAIEHLMSKILGSHRLFVLEYDFAKYFDSIRHDYLESILGRHFKVADQEMELLRKFLRNKRARSITDYASGKFNSVERGIPQGSNISLFLANVACFELDREIESVGVTFARYADDTLIVADTYAKADACAKLLLAHGERSGTKINFGKSPGISVLTPDINAEIRRKPAVDYLSHSLSSGGVRLSSKAIRRIRDRVVSIIYKNLLLQPKRKVVNPARCGPGFADWDLVTCVNELRRYLYGRMDESTINGVLSGTRQVGKTICALSFYPNVSDSGGEDFRALDGWMAATLARAYELRVKILSGLGVAASPILKKDLISGDWYTFPAIPMETRLPSFYKAWLYIRKASEKYGLEKFPAPSYEYI